MDQQMQCAALVPKIATAFASCIFIFAAVFCAACKKGVIESGAGSANPHDAQNNNFEKSDASESECEAKGEDDYKKGLALIEKSNGNGDEENLEFGRMLLKKAATEGHLGAAYILSRSYLKQRSPTKCEVDIGIEWLEKAATGGFPAAQSYLGELYQVGLYVVKDDISAARWLRKSAQAGDPDGMSNLYLLLAAGIGEPSNPSESAFWCRKVAALVADREDQFAMGLMLESGFGVRQDMAEAIKFYKLAAVQGHEMAGDRIEFLESRHYRPDADTLQRYVRNRLGY